MELRIFDVETLGATGEYAMLSIAENGTRMLKRGSGAATFVSIDTLCGGLLMKIITDLHVTKALYKRCCSQISVPVWNESKGATMHCIRGHARCIGGGADLPGTVTDATGLADLVHHTTPCKARSEEANRAWAALYSRGRDRGNKRLRRVRKAEDSPR